MIVRQIALSLVALLAISPDAFGQDRAANGAVADNQGEVVIRQGDEPDRFYIVADGEVDVVQHRVEGTDVLVATLHRGEVFGEIGILEEARRTADVRARTNVEVLALEWRDFKDLLDASDSTARDFMQLVKQRRAALSP